MNATTYGSDAAKRVFQMYWVDAKTGEIVNRRLGRDELIQFLAQRPPGIHVNVAARKADCSDRRGVEPGENWRCGVVVCGFTRTSMLSGDLPR